MKLNQLFGNPELVKVSDLKPYGHNAKHFDQSVYEDLYKSFKEFGDVGICLADIDGVLIDGNTRLKFFKDQKMEHCFVRKAIKKLTENQFIRLNAILDNIGNKPDFSVIDVEILEQIEVDYDTVVVHIEAIQEPEKQPKADKEPSFNLTLEYSEDEYRMVKDKLKSIGQTPEQVLFKALFD